MFLKVRPEPGPKNLARLTNLIPFLQLFYLFVSLYSHKIYTLIFYKNNFIRT